MARFDLLESERVAVERDHAEHQEPASEDDLPSDGIRRQRAVRFRTRHVHERVKFEVDARHRGHGLPDLMAARGECRGDLECDGANHEPSMAGNIFHNPHRYGDMTGW